MMLPGQDCKLPLEAAVFTAHAALRAQDFGVHRVELNAPGSYPHGGLTPPVSQYLACKDARIEVPLRIMIRPRGAPADGGMDFFYTPDEVEQMERSIAAFKAAGRMDPYRGDGFVFGALRHAGLDDMALDPNARVAVDTDVCARLVQAARPYGCCFHRAFDHIAGYDDELTLKGIKDVAACGFKCILTAGGTSGSYTTHLQKLDYMATKITQRSELGDIELVVGGGLRGANVATAVQKLGMHTKGRVWTHSAAVTDRRVGDDHFDEIELMDIVSMLSQAAVH